MSGLTSTGEDDSVVSSTRLGHYDDVLGRLQYLPGSDALNLMIVDNQHRNRRSVTL